MTGSAASLNDASSSTTLSRLSSRPTRCAPRTDLGVRLFHRTTLGEGEKLRTRAFLINACKNPVPRARDGTPRCRAARLGV